MIVALAFVNSFAVVASEGSHLRKTFFYLAILLVLSGICFLIIPSTVKMVI